MEEENKLIEERREKLKALRARGIAFPNDFRQKGSRLRSARKILGERQRKNSNP